MYVNEYRYEKTKAKIWTKVKKVNKHPPSPPKSPYGFKNLYPSKKPATVTQQLQKSIDFRQNELYDFHLGRE